MSITTDRRLTAEEFNLVASVLLLEGGATREALQKRFNQVASTWSQDLLNYFRFISGDKNRDVFLLPESSLSRLIEGYRLLRENDPGKAIKSFSLAFDLGLAAKLEYWTSLGLFGIGASCLWLQRLDLARDAFLRCIESGWALNDHAAVARGFGGLGNLFMMAGQPHLAFDAYSIDLGFIRPNHYLIPILRVRRALAFAMTHGTQQGLGMLLAETGDFFDKSSNEKKYHNIADQEAYRGLVTCSVVHKDRKIFDLLFELPESESKNSDSVLSVISYHLAGMYHNDGKRADHWYSARTAFDKLDWEEHPIRCWLTSLFSEDVLQENCIHVIGNSFGYGVSVPQIDVPELSFLDRFRQPKLTHSWAEWTEDDMELDDAIKFTLEHAMLSNSR